MRQLMYHRLLRNRFDFSIKFLGYKLSIWSSFAQTFILPYSSNYLFNLSQVLDYLEENSDITPFKIQRLRAKYSEAFQKLERYRDDEATLLNRARMFTEELEDQRSTLAEDQYTEEVCSRKFDF